MRSEKGPAHHGSCRYPVGGIGNSYAARSFAGIAEHSGADCSITSIPIFSWNSIKLGAVGTIGIADQGLRYSRGIAPSRVS